MSPADERARPARSEPYARGLVGGNPFWAKADVEGVLVAVLRLTFEDRGLLLEPYGSRAVPAGSVHELVLTDEPTAAPGSAVRRAAYLGFVQVTGGVIGVGDAVMINGRAVGRVVGFDATHVPNHYNVVIVGAPLADGAALGLTVGDRVVFCFGGVGGRG